MPHQLEINGVYFGNLESLNAVQTYERVSGGNSSRRAADGTLISQCFWTKLSTSISGTGVHPPGLSALVEGVDYTLKCLAPRTLSSASHLITVPTAKRADVAVEYSAWKGGALVDWDGVSNISADTYRATYVPEISARLVSKTESSDIYAARFQWSLIFEEI